MESAAVTMVEADSDIEALYRADADRLWRAVYAFAGDAEIASDAVAEAYAQVLRRGSAVRDPGAWVWRTAFRISRGELKDRRRDLSASPTSSDDLDQYADADLLRAVRQLPEGQRAAVILFYYADLPARQIADRLGTNSLAVRANLSRGRRRLRELLGDRDE
ncbi:MAG TPA: sigma-70 family RNA polymerase sigma factor [Candidatus Polarisedimenticolia bacterium]|nr:sigma-70 family RNA polymerase sigma factor [Candidatus Polarisedimenticolia bacterium]